MLGRKTNTTVKKVCEHKIVKHEVDELWDKISSARISSTKALARSSKNLVNLCVVPSCNFISHYMNIDHHRIITVHVSNSLQVSCFVYSVIWFALYTVLLLRFSCLSLYFAHILSCQKIKANWILFCTEKAKKSLYCFVLICIY